MIDTNDNNDNNNNNMVIVMTIITKITTIIIIIEIIDTNTKSNTHNNRIHIKLMMIIITIYVYAVCALLVEIGSCNVRLEGFSLIVGVILLDGVLFNKQQSSHGYSSQQLVGGFPLTYH